MTAPLVKNQPSPILDWNALTEAGAVCELANRIGVTLHVTPDGNLKATGNAKAAKLYLADIAARYRGAIIAHLLHLTLPEISDEQDMVNIGANAQALDVAITEYCAAVGYTVEHRDKLLAIRRRMAPCYMLQNLCAFRAWLYEVQNDKN